MRDVHQPTQRGDEVQRRSDVRYAGPPTSEIRFHLHHLLLAEVSGRVGRWNATLALDLEQPTRSSVEVVIDASSLETGAVERDHHTRSPEFLNIAMYPEIRFRSREIIARDGLERFMIVGDLTIRDVTREVTVLVERYGLSEEPHDHGGALEFTAHTTISRRDFGLRWHDELDRGGLIAGDNVDVEMQVVAQPRH
jgi:polyisoprenoid-binding protein YceI